MVSSTAPRLGPRWPPVRDTVCTSRSRISAASSGEFLAARARADRPGELTLVEHAGHDRQLRRRHRYRPRPSTVSPGFAPPVVRRVAISPATHSTWWVIGNASNARSAASRQPASSATRDVAGQRRRIAGHVADRARAEAEHGAHHRARRRRPAAGRARRGPARTSSAGQPCRRRPARGAPSPRAGRPGCRAASATACGRRLEPDDPAGRRRPRRRATAVSGAGAGVQVEHGLPRLRVRRPRQSAAANVSQRVRVHLPEAGGGHVERPRAEAVAQRVRAVDRRSTRSGGRRPRAWRPGPGRCASTVTAPSSPRADLDAGGTGPRADGARRPPRATPSGQRATGSTSCERCRCSPTAPSRADRVADPGAPAEQPAGQLLHRRRSVEVDPGQTAELLAHDGGLQRALRRRRRRAASRSRRSGPARRAGTAASTRSGDAMQHLDRVGAAERAAAVLGDHGPHPLAGQGVPDEHDTTARAGHAEPAVSWRAHVEVEQAAAPALSHCRWA